jgi:hypothetical protein
MNDDSSGKGGRTRHSQEGYNLQLILAKWAKNFLQLKSRPWNHVAGFFPMPKRGMNTKALPIKVAASHGFEP